MDGGLLRIEKSNGGNVIDNSFKDGGIEFRSHVINVLSYILF